MIRIGTRGSALALAQATWVAQRFDQPTELVTISASGPATDKSRWVSELERALLEERIDIAVHSAKDVPGELPENLELIAIPEREDPRDAICGAASLADLEPGAKVGTSSLRRAAQIRAAREDLDVVAVRGNVDTRLRKLAEGEFDALVLAAAGLKRLRKQPDGILDELVPAAGQGALALEARTDAQIEVPRALHDVDVTACVEAERELTRALDASCNTPLGAHARITSEGELELEAWVGLPDGSVWLRDRVKGGHRGTGRLLAQRLLSAGADQLLRQAERMLAA